MQTVIYTEKLKSHLKLLGKAFAEFSKVENHKPLEQFLGEIDSLKQMLDEAKYLSSGLNNH